MSSSNSPTKIQNPKSSNLLETAEVVFLAASAVGLAASLVWGQSVYAQVPVVISLVLNFVNRQKLHRQVKASTAATFDQVNQQAVTTDRARSWERKPIVAFFFSTGASMLVKIKYALLAAIP